MAEFSLDEMRTALEKLEKRIFSACVQSNRSRESVKLVWVSKFHPIEAVKNAETLGATDFGENRVQEAVEKFMARDPKIHCHIIGPMQSNKLKKAALVADCIHSVASVEAVEKLEKVCAEAGKALDILFQVNAGEEETKSGLEIHEAEPFLLSLEKQGPFPHIRFRGLMTIGKNTGVAEDSRECFAFLRRLQQKFLTRGDVFKNFDQLSMGMTGDLEVAIEEGATMVRVGTALFGERVYGKKQPLG